MNERQLQSFITAADSASFTKAAEASHISTTAFIQQIRLLEEDVGFKLFSRTPRGITLTTAGTAFYKDASKILKLYTAACERGRKIEKAEALSLRIAYSNESIPGFLLDAVNSYRQKYSEAAVDFIPAAFAQYIDAVSGGSADIAAIAEPAEHLLSGLTFHPLIQDTLSFCMHPHHPLSSCPSLDIKDLQGYTIVCGRYEYLKEPFQAKLQGYGLTLRPINTEYTMSFRTGQLSSDEIFVLHSMWSQAYTRFFNVIPSNIPAGRIGIIYRNPASEAVQHFLSCLSQ